MPLPEPEPGLVVRYDYLWAREAAVGRQQDKDRPACLIAASDPSVRPRFVVLLPITHTPPAPDVVGIEIPDAVRRHLGLDHERSWVILSEHNVDEWPSAGLSRLPGSREAFSYGFIPPSLFRRIKDAFLVLSQAKRTRGVRR